MAFLVTLLVGCAGPLPAGDPAQPDIVLVSIDSLRADHLSSHGYRRETSPNLDRLAERGLRFTDARAASPWTLPSHMTMFTGLWPVDHMVIEDTLALSPSVPWLPEALRERGFATAGFVSTIYVSKDFGFGRGFDLYEDYGVTEKENLEHPVRIHDQVGDVRRWVRENGRGKPVFVFLHTYDVHYPYMAPPPYNVEYNEALTRKQARYLSYSHYKKRPPTPEQMQRQVDQYDECIRYVDAQVARLHALWADAGREAWFVVTADHGEEFLERGSWGHAHTLNPEQVHIPMIVVGPGITPAVREDRVGTIDVAATLAAFAGLPWTGDGRDLRSPVPERRFWLETSRRESNRLSLLHGPLRFELDLARGAAHLYDAASDPGERADLAEARPGEADRLRREVLDRVGERWVTQVPLTLKGGAAWREGAVLGRAVTDPGRFGAWPPDLELRGEGVEVAGVYAAPELGAVGYDGPRPVVPVHLDDATRAQLEALGYLQGDDEAGEGAAP